jgi:DNA-binding transcriptional LysR family regulator
MPALPHFKVRHPTVGIEFLELSPQAQIESLRSQRIDLGFIGSACEELRSEFELALIQEIPLTAVLPDTHTFASHKRIRLSELSSDVFVGFAEKTQSGRLEAMCGPLRVKSGPITTHRVFCRSL